MELPTVSVNAMVLQYDSAGGQWKELGSESGFCVLTILKSPTNEYRYVGQKISNNELVLNAYIFPEMKYDESTATFHQWYDKNKNAFGLNFADANMAKKYAAGIACALEQLNSAQIPPKSATPGNEKSTFSTTSSSAPKKNTDSSSSRTSSKVSPYATSPVGNSIAPSGPTTAPPKITPAKASAGAPPPPGPPPSAPAPPGPPPPGPAPPKAPAAAGNDFASQLKRAAAQHKEVNIDESLNKPAAVVPEAKPPAQAPASGGMDFLTEMRQRMSKQKGADGVAAPPGKANTPKVTPSFASSNVNNTQQLTITKPSICDPESATPTYVTASELEKFRTDLMNDIVEHMDRMKNEIISSISAKLK